MKAINVKTSGSGVAKNVKIEPGTTSDDILKHLNLDGYELQHEETQHKFKPRENLYPQLEDGGELIATPEAIVGTGIR